MPSLKNAIPHKERAQPRVMFCFPPVAMLVVAVTCVSGLLILFLNDRQTRKKFGLPEKHKDYVDPLLVVH